MQPDGQPPLRLPGQVPGAGTLQMQQLQLQQQQQQQQQQQHLQGMFGVNPGLQAQIQAQVCDATPYGA